MVLKDKVVVITGASEGIGKALAERLAKDGALLALTARNADGLQTVVDSIKASGGNAEPFTCDARNEDQIKKVL